MIPDALLLLRVQKSRAVSQSDNTERLHEYEGNKVFASFKDYSGLACCDAMIPNSSSLLFIERTSILFQLDLVEQW
jgi:hypothetical protein